MTLVLIIEDEAQLARAMQINLRAHGYQAITAGFGADGLKLAAQHPVDIVVLDLGLPDMDGVEVIRGIRGWSSACRSSCCRPATPRRTRWTPSTPGRTTT